MYNKVSGLYMCFLPGQLFSQSLNNRPAVVNTKEGSAVDDDSYLGYSVAVGDFGDVDGSGAAVGMPRGAGLLGKVLFSSFLPNGMRFVHQLVYVC
jgi:hypothetical protein